MCARQNLVSLAGSMETYDFIEIEIEHPGGSFPS